MEDYLSAELTATCAVLGYFDGTNYHLDKYCLDVIKDLIRYLKRDDDTHTIRRFLGRSKLLQKDLVKILIHHVSNTELWDVLLRLIINLTSPAFVIFNEQIPTEKTMYNFYQQIISYLHEYKAALTDDSVWSVVATRLGNLLNIDNTERDEENEMTIERILILIRNVLQVPSFDNDKRTGNDATVHDEILFAYHTSGIVDILLFIVSNKKEQQYHMQILEIISLMLREQNARQLAASELQRSTAEKENDEATLVALLEKEQNEKTNKMKKYAGSRHSQFGGTYVVQNMKAIGENQMICHKPYQKIEALEFGHNKKRVKKRKDKIGPQETKEERMSVLSVRLFLKEFCVEFLSGAYNPVMKFGRSCIINGDVPDTVSYLWALRFFMEFNRHYKFEVKYVSETISTEIFHLVQRQIDQYYEMILTDKKRIPIWSRRLHIALKAYQELLNTLMAMDKSTFYGVRESSKIIKSNIFYVPEYRETIFLQFLYYDENKMSRLYLVDLVTTVHIFLKMLEHFCEKEQRHLIVQKVKLKRQKVKKQKKPAPKDTTPTVTLEERWDTIGPEITVVMQGGAIPEVIPFDATLETPIDDQKEDAMKRIQKLMRQKNLEQAVGLLRAAREIWPENDCFGRANIPPEEEFLALREIFFTDLGVVEDQPVAEGTINEDEDIENSVNHEVENEEDDEEEEGETVFQETDFKLDEFVQRFANVKVVKALTLLLQQFEVNTIEVNHYVTKMLYRIAWICKMPAMIFQASIFRVFQRILESKNPVHKELQKFAVFIIRRFVEVAQKNRKSYMELLFWKTSRDATEIVDGYSAETSNKKVSRAVWTEAEEDELRTLFMEHQTNKYPQDLIDWLLEHIINEDRTRRTVIKKLREMCLVVNSKGVRAEVQKRLPKEWSEEETAQLTELWTQFKDDDDPVDLIFTGLRIKRPKPKIKERLLELGLAQDRKELRKKRARKSNQGKSSWETQAASNSDGNESSATDEDEEETRKSSKRDGGAPRRSEPTKKKQRNRRKLPTIVYTDAQLFGLLKDVIDRNMREALEWIKESLQDILDDRDEESFEGIPLVPLTDYSSAAMDSPSFQKLLRAMGFVPPADAQESYWRVPANMLTTTIQKRYKLIGDVLAGEFVVADTQAELRSRDHSDTDEKLNDSEDDADVFENVKKFFATKEPVPSTSRQSEPIVETQLHKKSKGSPMLHEENDDAEVVGKISAENAESKARSRAIILDDSSESEMEIERNVDDKNDISQVERNTSDSSDTAEPLKKKRRLLDSDDETGSLRDENIGEKGVRMVISDDEASTSDVRSGRPKSSRVIISDEED
ncbi:PREDICTED: protein timeless homolog [Dinoponera quadriceps]|uniref:Protein timeless homolog n=1 Tax=Dinoponera quadriceps TaxID=609295 RepID=A0A6P3XB40_DINQU|nr:PREDICTED: protein timeless homolog [Dinoponera quadriceps]